MNFVDAGKFLTVVTAVDNRKVTKETIAVWCDLLEEVSLDDALTALKQFRRARPGVYLEPGHIVEIVNSSKHVVRQWDGGVRRPPAPPGQIYAADIIEGIEA